MGTWVNVCPIQLTHKITDCPKETRSNKVEVELWIPRIGRSECSDIWKSFVFALSGKSQYPTFASMQGYRPCRSVDLEQRHHGPLHEGAIIDV
jgi:hypothetical protein